MNCAHFRGDLSQEEARLVNKMLQHYKAETILESWVRRSRLKIPGGSRIDQEKARVTETLRRQALCPHENVLVSPIDTACYAFKPTLANC
jgi:hypothetical protein